MIATKPVNLKALENEMSAAGVSITALGMLDSDPEDPNSKKTIYTYDADGHIAPLPPEAEAVIKAHVAG